MLDPSPLRGIDFWIAVFVALVVKIKTSRQLSPLKVITTIVVAIGASVVAADYAARMFGVPVSIATAIVTLTAEGHASRADHLRARLSTQLVAGAG